MNEPIGERLPPGGIGPDIASAGPEVRLDLEAIRTGPDVFRTFVAEPSRLVRLGRRIRDLVQSRRSTTIIQIQKQGRDPKEGFYRTLDD